MELQSDASRCKETRKETQAEPLTSSQRASTLVSQSRYSSHPPSELPNMEPWTTFQIEAC